jgi:hypothetical protein
MGRVRMSRGRVLLRAALLLGGGGVMLWRAVEARRVSRLLSAADAALQDRVALVEGLVGLLAVLTGLAALLALRPRRRRHTLHIEGEGRGPDGPLRP